MQGKSLLRQLEERGLDILPLLENVENDEVRHAIREFVSTVQAVRILTEKMETNEPPVMADWGQEDRTIADVA